MSANNTLVQILNEYCSGCGLCKNEFKCSESIENGFIKYNISPENAEVAKKYCPVINEQKLDAGSVWGKFDGMYFGWSNDYDIRTKASSGGVLTSLAIFLLEQNYVDGIIQVKQSDEVPWNTMLQCSTSKEKVLNCCGSRYAQSSPLSSISDIINADKKYAFVGKPCDVAALKAYINSTGNFKNNVLYFLSFFCAGVPSIKANERLVGELLGDISNCKSLTYRGNGWPGMAIATSYNNEEKCMDYEKSWGSCLGRDVRKGCRFCMDGIGLKADISCGDAWYLTEDGRPDFSEKDGRNVIICRTDSGCDIIGKAFDMGYIQIENFENYDTELKKMQPYQFSRRTTMKARIDAMKLFGRKTPIYNQAELKKLNLDTGFKQSFRIFGGTIKRILKNKI